MWKVANRDSGEMLFMMGGHPAFSGAGREKTYTISPLNLTGEGAGRESLRIVSIILRLMQTAMRRKNFRGI